MAYRKIGMWEIHEVSRRVARGEPQRAIQRATGYRRTTIRRWLRAAHRLCWKPGDRFAEPGKDWLRLLRSGRCWVSTSSVPGSPRRASLLSPWSLRGMMQRPVRGSRRGGCCRKSAIPVEADVTLHSAFPRQRRRSARARR